MVLGIHQPQYFPYLGFFHKLARCDSFILLDDVQFMKNSHQNRNRIKTAQGWQWLTVPVLHRCDQLISEVLINPKVNWPRKHWAALQTNYGKAPYFSRYSSGIREILESGYEDLCGLDVALLRWLVETLEISTPLLLSSDVGAGEGKTQRLVDLCRIVGADTYLSGPGGRRYMEMELFEEAGIEVEFQEYEGPTYPQMFPEVGFEPHLSVLDALFCWGPATADFLAP